MGLRLRVVLNCMEEGIDGLGMDVIQLVMWMDRLWLDTMQRIGYSVPLEGLRIPM